MGRSVYYIRGNKATALPSRILILDTETETETVQGLEVQYMTMGWTWFVELGNTGAILREEWKFWHSRPPLQSYVLGLCKTKKTLYVIGSNVLFDLFASGLALALAQAEYKAKVVYDKGLRTIISLAKGSRRIKFLALQNWLEGSVRQWGEMIGLPKLEVDFETSTSDEMCIYCHRDAEITGTVFLEYLNFIRSRDLGGFAVTIGSQALRAYRHRFMEAKILHYDEPQVNEIIRSSYFGGRTECFQIGEIKGRQVVKVDVNSMYPHVMKDNLYPTVFRQWVKDPDLFFLKARLERFSCISHCRVNTTSPAYAFWDGQRLLFPVGRFDAYLCSGSLSYALAHAHIEKVHDALFFEQARLFDSYVDYFYPLKQDFKDSGNRVWEKTVKMFLNQLYGKFGEKREEVIINEEADPLDFFREDVYYGPDQIKGIEFACWGRYLLVGGENEGPMSMPAIASHVTDYARMHLFNLLQQVGPDNLLYCDTDSIFLYKEGLDNLRDSLDESALGALKVEGETDHLIIHGCKDYEFGETTKIKGIRKDAHRDSDGNYRQDVFPSLATILRLGVLDGYPMQSTSKHLRREYLKGLVDTTGKVSPVHL